MYSKILTTRTLRKFRHFSATVSLQKFRQINVLQKNFTVDLT